MKEECILNQDDTSPNTLRNKDGKKLTTTRRTSVLFLLTSNGDETIYYCNIVPYSFPQHFILMKNYFSNQENSNSVEDYKFVGVESGYNEFS